jgi:hypothetical protein
MRLAIRIILATISVLLLLLLFRIQKNRSQIEEEVAYNAELPKTIILKSDAFGNGEQIPVEYTANGANISPPLSWDSTPVGTKSLAILVTDYDAPSPSFKMMIVGHWVLYNIPHNLQSIEKGISKTVIDSLHITVGKNVSGKNEYTGPRPPFGVHSYYFRIYALDFNSLFLKNDNRNELYKAMVGHILGYGELIGKF